MDIDSLMAFYIRDEYLGKGGVVVVNGLAWTTILYPVIETAEQSEDDAKSRSGAEG